MNISLFCIIDSKYDFFEILNKYDSENLFFEMFKIFYLVFE